MDPVGINKDLHQWRGKNTIAIIHVETEVTASPAPEANWSPAGCHRRRETLPLCIALSHGSPARLCCGLHKGRNTLCFLSLVTVAQHRNRICMQRGREDFPLQEREGTRL